jgi:hypothetical protein
MFVGTISPLGVALATVVVGGAATLASPVIAYVSAREANRHQRKLRIYDDLKVWYESMLSDAYAGLELFTRLKECLDDADKDGAEGVTGDAIDAAEEQRSQVARVRLYGSKRVIKAHKKFISEWNELHEILERTYDTDAAQEKGKADAKHAIDRLTPLITALSEAASDDVTDVQPRADRLWKLSAVVFLVLLGVGIGIVGVKLWPTQTDSDLAPATIQRTAQVLACTQDSRRNLCTPITGLRELAPGLWQLSLDKVSGCWLIPTEGTPTKASCQA